MYGWIFSRRHFSCIFRHLDDVSTGNAFLYVVYARKSLQTKESDYGSSDDEHPHQDNKHYTYAELMQWGLERLKLNQDMHDYEQRMKDKANLLRNLKFQQEMEEYNREHVETEDDGGIRMEISKPSNTTRHERFDQLLKEFQHIESSNNKHVLLDEDERRLHDKFQKELSKFAGMEFGPTSAAGSSIISTTTTPATGTNKSSSSILQKLMEYEKLELDSHIIPSIQKQQRDELNKRRNEKFVNDIIHEFEHNEADDEEDDTIKAAEAKSHEHPHQQQHTQVHVKEGEELDALKVGMVHLYTHNNTEDATPSVHHEQHTQVHVKEGEELDALKVGMVHLYNTHTTSTSDPVKEQGTTTKTPTTIKPKNESESDDEEERKKYITRHAWE